MPPTPIVTPRGHLSRGRGLATRASATVACLALAVSLSSCSTGDDTEPAGSAATQSETPAPTLPSESAATPSPTQTPSPSTSPTAQPEPELPPFSEGTGRQINRGPSTAQLVLTDLRTAQHDGYGRVVLEFSGTGIPGWTVNYVNKAVQEGSGQPITVDGDAVLDVFAAGTTYPADGFYSGPKRVAGDGTVSDVFVGGTFEGDTHVVAGIDGGRKPFRVFTLTNPSRLVIDVADSTSS